MAPSRSASSIVLVLVVVLVLDLLARERYHPDGCIRRRTVSVCSVLKEQSGTLRLRSTTSSFREVRSSGVAEWMAPSRPASSIVLVLVVVLVLLARERYHPDGCIRRRTVSVCSVLKEQSGTLRLRSTTSSFREVRSSGVAEWMAPSRPASSIVLVLVVVLVLLARERYHPDGCIRRRTVSVCSVLKEQSGTLRLRSTTSSFREVRSSGVAEWMAPSRPASSIVLVLVVVLVLLARERYHPDGCIRRRTVSVCSVLKEQSGTLRLRSTTSSFREVRSTERARRVKIVEETGAQRVHAAVLALRGGASVVEAVLTLVRGVRAL